MSIIDALLDFERQNMSQLTVPVANSKSVRCLRSGCHNNVPYKFLDKNDAYCRRCHITCTICKCTVTPDDSAEGMYKGLCIDCTRCELCNIPMWDYVCACELR